MMPQKVRITVGLENFFHFWVLLSYGFKLEVQVGCNLFDMLCNQIGIKEKYLNEKVQTVFLNGKVVDGFYDVNVGVDSVIALSSAMPGLVGAVFRKGGVLSSMRSEHVPHKESESINNHNIGLVTLKLFNLIASDLGADFYRHGIYIKGQHFIRYIESKQAVLEKICRKIIVDGKKCESGDLLIICRSEADIVLFVNPV